ncbi:uncharacterized protein LOC112183344 [Rosa chinensis]|uniref:uncharacterized protein LOC112183344 n=1 Tax=Rosa chinensis TaxID=74649 RepID=UPI000D08B9AC|nr:uncharacterized protein LOC112183344 [Rosa chinensis]
MIPTPHQSLSLIMDAETDLSPSDAAASIFLPLTQLLIRISGWKSKPQSSKAVWKFDLGFEPYKDSKLKWIFLAQSCSSLPLIWGVWHLVSGRRLSILVVAFLYIDIHVCFGLLPISADNETCKK